MRRLALLLLFAVLCCGCSPKDKDREIEAPQSSELDLLSLASVQMPGWQEEKASLIDNAEDLVDYLGNEAELYLAYGLRRLAVKKYRNDRSLPILVEIYDFGSSEDAYGIYSFDTVGDKPEIGQGAVYSHGLLRFWKDKLQVKVLAREEYAELEEDVLSFGRSIDSRILTTGSRPHIVTLIPEEKLIPDSLHFFHENICLNNICYIPESIALGLSEQTDAVTAQYDLSGKQPPLLLLISYPNGIAAETAFKEFGAQYYQGEPMDTDRPVSVMKVEEDEYSSIALIRNFVILVFSARNPDICRKLVAATLAKIELYGKPAGQ